MMRKYHVRFGGGLSQKYLHVWGQLGDRLPYPGADYESILAELGKYGANLVLATQSLARLDGLDRDHQRALKATLFANLDGLFAFHTSAEDARYLVPELGADLEVEDLASLGEHRCYARLSVDRQRLPVFSVELDPPPPDDPERRDSLIAESAQRYGRDRLAAEADLRAALDRIARCRGEPTTPPAGRRAGGRARNQHRNQPDLRDGWTTDQHGAWAPADGLAPTSDGPGPEGAARR
jgi:hypothetical protein